MKNRFRELALICILGLVVAGCAPRPGGGQTAAMAGDDELVVDLPSLVLDVANDGSTSIGGFGLGELTGGQGVTFPADSVQALAALNVQHIGIDMHPAGLTLRVNGLPFLGSMQYDSESLGNISSIMEEMAQGATLTALGDLAPIVSALTPVLDNLGIGVIVKFPVAAGAAPIPLIIEPMHSSMEGVENFLASVQQQPRISVPIFLAEDGSWSVGELNQALVEGLLDAQGTLGLPPETVAMMTLGGVKELQVNTAENGLAIAINGHGLPIFTWNNGEIESLMALQESAPTLVGVGEVLGLVSNVLPLLQISDVTITLIFPDM